MSEQLLCCGTAMQNGNTTIKYVSYLCNRRNKSTTNELDSTNKLDSDLLFPNSRIPVRTFVDDNIDNPTFVENDDGSVSIYGTTRHFKDADVLSQLNQNILYCVPFKMVDIGGRSSFYTDILYKEQIGMSEFANRRLRIIIGPKIEKHRFDGSFKYVTFARLRRDFDTSKPVAFDKDDLCNSDDYYHALTLTPAKMRTLTYITYCEPRHPRSLPAYYTYKSNTHGPVYVDKMATTVDKNKFLSQSIPPFNDNSRFNLYENACRYRLFSIHRENAETGGDSFSMTLDVWLHYVLPNLVYINNLLNRMRNLNEIANQPAGCDETD